MTVKEYDAMMEANGTPKVWMVVYAFTCPGLTHSRLFGTEQEARAFADQCLILVSVGQTWDIWNWTARHSGRVTE